MTKISMVLMSSLLVASAAKAQSGPLQVSKVLCSAYCSESADSALSSVIKDLNEAIPVEGSVVDATYDKDNQDIMLTRTIAKNPIVASKPTDPVFQSYNPAIDDQPISCLRYTLPNSATMCLTVTIRQFNRPAQRFMTKKQVNQRPFANNAPIFWSKN